MTILATCHSILLSLEENATKYLSIGKYSQKRVETTESFWNKGKNRLIERKEFLQGQEKYYELIHEIQLEEIPPTWEILRAIRIEGTFHPIFHSRIVTNPDGSEGEVIILSSRSDSTVNTSSK